MSKLGVRNIDGFNARVAEAAAKGETITRTVQTGFDRETGEAIYEQEEMDLSELPYIVVIVDEMADLMMVAGKDIEGRDPAPRADGARRRHPSHHGDAAPLGRRHHRHDQGELSDPHFLPGDVQDRQPHDPGRAGRGAAARPGRHALYGRRRAHLARAWPLRLGRRSREDRRASEDAGPAGISDFAITEEEAPEEDDDAAPAARSGYDGRRRSRRLLRPRGRHRAARPQVSRRAISSAASPSATTKPPRWSSAWRRKASSARPTTPASARSWSAAGPTARRSTKTRRNERPRARRFVCRANATAASALQGASAPTRRTRAKGLSGNNRPIRHCEQSEVIQTWAAHLRLSLDCFAVARNDGSLDSFIP